MKTIFLILMVLLLFIGCDDTEHVSNNESIKRNISAYDANSNKLGILLSGGGGLLIILNDSGYIYTIDWSGEFQINSFYYFPDNLCVGDIYVGVGLNGIYQKNVYYREVLDFLYVPDSTEYNVRGELLSYKSYEVNGVCYDNAGNGVLTVKLKEVTKIEAGIPDITGPIYID
jgi:hypothetical protein